MPPMDFCRFSPHWGMQSIPNFSGDLLHLTYWGSFKYSSPVHWVCKPSFNLLPLMNIRVWTVYAEFPPAYICVCHRFQDESSPFSQRFTVTLSSVAISCISRGPTDVRAGLISTPGAVKAASHRSGDFGQASRCPSHRVSAACAPWAPSERWDAGFVQGNASVGLTAGKALQPLCWFSPLLWQSWSVVLKTQLNAWPFFLFCWVKYVQGSFCEEGCAGI